MKHYVVYLGEMAFCCLRCDYRWYWPHRDLMHLWLTDHLVRVPPTVECVDD